MGLKIGLTGHTAGFGKAIAKRIENLGHDVIGISRKTGYNLLTNTDAIFNNKFDILINNAEVGNAQLILAVNCARKEIPCINIGSKITEAKVVTQEDIIKKDNKIALMNFSMANKQVYLTWGFLAGHKILGHNPDLLETISIHDAVEEVINELDFT